LQELLVDPWKAYRWLPLKDLNSIRELVPSWMDWISHSSRDNFWKATAIDDRYGDIQVPALHIGGWYDIFLKGTLENYLGLKEFAGSENARKNQRLIIGPWAHAVPHSTIGEIDFGPNAGQPNIDMTAVHLDWFGSFLKKGTPNKKAASPVRLFVMGINQWRDEEDWPLARAQMTRFYLHGMGKANPDDGVLSHEPPGEDEPQDMFIYDPHSPVPSVGGSTFLPGLFVGLHAGPRDQRLIEQRSDIIVYTSLPLEEDTEVTGPVTLTLYASTSAVDTDWTAKLVDVLPDGRANIICDGILRARFRSGLEVPKLLEPDRVYRFLIDMAATSMVFCAGHRIRLEISSSNFPRFDRNPNNGKTSAEITEADFIVARQMVFHNANYPSHLNLPIIP
jgi:putative CocE/NonD family hydrolase